MKVLLIATDLYRNIGGGQTVYRRLIESAPEVQFFYFREDEQERAPRPGNATAIPLSIRLKLKVLGAPPYPAFKLAHLQDADRFARSVAGRHFDIADIPDYFAFGSLLRDAFAHHRITVERIVLAMHGNISVSLEMAWGSGGDNVLEQRMLECEQFESADGVYGISPRYIREWQSLVNRPVHYIDPLAFVDVPTTLRCSKLSVNGKPNLYCIGRTERRKGNDLFVELVRWIDPSLFGKAAHIGDELVASWGVGTRAILFDIAEKRDRTIDYFPSFNREQLRMLFQEPCLVILPVRYDSLNLIALEALFEGCPIAVSSEAGVCDYLDSTHPTLPFVKIDFANFYRAASSINDLLANYNQYRKALQDRLSELPFHARPTPGIQTIYKNILRSASTAVGEIRAALPYYESGQTTGARVARLAKRILPVDAYRETKVFLKAPGKYFHRKLRESEYFGDAKYLGVISDSMRVPARLKRISEHSEHNKSRLREKLNEIYAACINPLYRCNFWLDIARIERILGNELVAVTYELRALRLVGTDKFGILPRVVRTLEANRLTYEAAAAQALYADADRAHERVYGYLKERYERNLLKPATPFERVDDRRHGTPKVAVIVSLYNAAPKLLVFLTTIIQQTMIKSGQVEIIFVDSGSPDNEYDVIEQFWKKTPINAVYARSQQRETIQAAWNRGIELATAPYLVFLGVDETLYPDALEVLSLELDRHPAIDWIMANSLVTAVDNRGIYKNDVMPYDRNGGTKDHVYLETCYLSWVGGMYRKSIHERFGFYDESFGAAGDTEFKNRILPHIMVKFVPRTLGLFLNYPDERTTASPKAEIEDLRAWYIHRTPGGVEYAFAERSVDEAASLLTACLGYRKSYCRHISTDIEYATHLSAFLHSRKQSNSAFLASVFNLLVDLRTMEYAETPPKPVPCARRMLTTWRRAMQFDRTQDLDSRASGAAYKILNDNRFEQHSWLWKTT
jgi:glycosyltransferase involved in cell wall biosynthesis